MSSLPTLVLFAILAPPSEPLRVDGDVRLSLSAATSRAVSFLVERAEPLVLALTSTECEGRVTVLRDDGSVVVEHAGGGALSDGWAVFVPTDVDVGTRLRFEIEGGAACAGVFTVGVSRGADELEFAVARAWRHEARRDGPNSVAAWQSVLAWADALGERESSVLASHRLAIMFHGGGFFDQALPHAERALEAARGVGDEEAVVALLRLAGSIRQESGEYSRAVERLEEAVERAHAIGAREEEWLAAWTLTAILQRTGEYEATIDRLLDLRALAREIGQPRYEGLALNGLGNAYQMLDRHEEALAQFRAWLEICRDEGDLRNEPMALSSVANVLRALGRKEEARPYLVEAWELVEGRGAAHTVGRIAGTLAFTDAYAGRIEPAREWLARARASLEKTNAPDVALIANAARVRIALADEDLAAARAAFEAVDALLDRIVAAGLSPAQMAGFRAHFEAIPYQVQDLVALAVHAASGDAERRAALEAGFRETERWKARGLLLELGGVDAAVEDVSVAEVQARILRPGRILVEFAQSAERVFAYVMTHDDLVFLPLAPMSEITPHAVGFVRAVGDAHDIGKMEDVIRHGRALYDALLAPALERVGSDVREIVIVPPRSLPLLPFEALVVSAGEHVEYVLDRHTVAIGPSAAVLVALARRPSREGARGALVLADPEYGERYVRLPGTRDEAFAVIEALASGDVASRARAALEGRRDVSFEEGDVALHVGRSATRARLAGDLTGASWIHFGTHGEVDLRRPARTGLLLADGRLTRDDVAGLRLDADLVVLSACETARGRQVRGEGAFSLARSFLGAGARAVIANRWAVSDRASAAIMGEFYGGIREGLRPAAALRRAQRAFVTRGGPVDRRRRGVGVVRAAGVGMPAPARHPYWWASFQFVGLP